MHPRILVIGAFLLGDAPTIQAQDLDISVTIEARYAYGTERGSSQSAEIEVRPNWDLSLSDKWSLRGGARIRADGFDRLERGHPDQKTIDPLSQRGLIGKTTEMELREGFFQYAGDNTTVRFGKQQIVWGRADGLKVLDIVNPQTFREFILDDFDQSRTPLWSLLVDRTIFDLDFQGFWIFDQTFSEAPPFGSVFEITAPEFVPTFLSLPSENLVLADPDKPDSRFGDSEFGLQVSGLVGNWDFSLNYFNTIEDTPYFDLEYSPAHTTITPRFNRVDILGTSFANSWSDFTLRGEAAITFGETIPIALQENMADVSVQANVAKYVLGVDYIGIPNTFISAQFSQKIRLNSTPEPVTPLVPSAEAITTLFVRHDLYDTNWTLEFRWYANHHNKDGLIRSHIKHQLDDSAQITLGGDFFYGASKGVFGQFSDADRVTLTYSYVF